MFTELIEAVSTRQTRQKLVTSLAPRRNMHTDFGRVLVHNLHHTSLVGRQVLDIDPFACFLIHIRPLRVGKVLLASRRTHKYVRSSSSHTYGRPQLSQATN